MTGHRVIPHEPICPQCGSFNIATEEVETGDGLTETAYICHTCGEAWPLACVTDWSPPAPVIEVTVTPRFRYRDNTIRTGR